MCARPSKNCEKLTKNHFFWGGWFRIVQGHRCW